MELVPQTIVVEPGHLGCLEVRLDNSGPEPCDVVVAVPQADRYWAWVHPESCDVAAGGKGVVGVYFKPGCGPRPTAGRHRVPVNASCAGDPAVSATADAIVEVMPFSDVVATLDPLVGRGERGCSYSVRLENRGNVAMRAALHGDDPSGGALVLDVDPSQLDAAPGELATATLAVRPRKPLRRGEQRHRVCVVARVEGDGELRAEGSFYQQGRRPAR
jgi:hypothetical protein